MTAARALAGSVHSLVSCEVACAYLWSRGAAGSAAREGLPRGGGGGASGRSLGASRSRGYSITEMIVTTSLWLSSRACQCNNASTLRMGPESNMRFRALEVLAATIKSTCKIHQYTWSHPSLAARIPVTRSVARCGPLVPAAWFGACSQERKRCGRASSQHLIRGSVTPCEAGIHRKIVSQRKCQLTAIQVQDPELGSIERLEKGLTA